MGCEAVEGGYGVTLYHSLFLVWFLKSIFITVFAGLNTEPGNHNSRFIFSPNLINLGVQILDTRDKRFSMHSSFNTQEAGFIKHVDNLHVYCRLNGTHAQCVLHKKAMDPAYMVWFCSTVFFITGKALPVQAKRMWQWLIIYCICMCISVWIDCTY